VAPNQADLETIISAVKAKMPPDLRALTCGPMVQTGRGKRPAPHAGPNPFPLATAFRISVDGRRATAGLLAGPYTSRLVYLDKPILIWQHPNPNTMTQFIDWQIEPSNSQVRIKLYGEGRGFQTQVWFYYLWRNDSADPVVINVDTPVVIKGSSFAQGRGRFFRGSKTIVLVHALLALQRWSGWGTDPNTGASLDQTFVGALELSRGAVISSLAAVGGSGPFAREGWASQSFNYQPFELSMKSFQVPGRASIMLPVILYFYGSMEGDTLEDVAEVDFCQGAAAFSPYATHRSNADVDFDGASAPSINENERLA